MDGSADDITGLGNSDTNFGALPSANRNNTVGKAIHINGASHIDFPILNTRGLGAKNTGFTVSMWMLPESLGPIFGDYAGTATGGDQILSMQLAVDNFPSNGPLSDYLSAGSRNNPALGLDYTLYRGNAPIIDTQWHYVVYRMDGVGSCFVNLDGERVGVLPYNPSLNYNQNPQWQAGRLLFAGQHQSEIQASGMPVSPPHMVETNTLDVVSKAVRKNRPVTEGEFRDALDMPKAKRKKTYPSE